MAELGKLVRNLDYLDEDDYIFMPDWVTKGNHPMPRLKSEHRAKPNAPWTPNEKALKEIAAREARVKQVKEMEK